MPPVSPTRSSNNHSPPPRRTNRSSVQGRGRKMHANFLAAAGGEDVQRHRLERMRQRALARARNMERVADRERRGWTTEGMVTNMRVFNLNPEDNYEDFPDVRAYLQLLGSKMRDPIWMCEGNEHLEDEEALGVTWGMIADLDVEKGVRFLMKMREQGKGIFVDPGEINDTPQNWKTLPWMHASGFVDMSRDDQAKFLSKVTFDEFSLEKGGPITKEAHSDDEDDSDYCEASSESDDSVASDEPAGSVVTLPKPLVSRLSALNPTSFVDMNLVDGSIPAQNASFVTAVGASKSDVDENPDNSVDGNEDAADNSKTIVPISSMEIDMDRNDDSYENEAMSSDSDSAASHKSASNGSDEDEAMTGDSDSVASHKSSSNGSDEAAASDSGGSDNEHASDSNKGNMVDDHYWKTGMILGNVIIPLPRSAVGPDDPEWIRHIHNLFSFTRHPLYRVFHAPPNVKPETLFQEDKNKTVAIYTAGGDLDDDDKDEDDDDDDDAMADLDIDDVVYLVQQRVTVTEFQLM